MAPAKPALELGFSDRFSVVIDAKYTELAVRALHDAFIGNAPARAPEKRP